MRQPPQDENSRKSLQNMSSDNIKDYMQQGTYGIQKLYHDTGMPEKAEQYGKIQEDIQDKVYQGNARMLDIKDPSQLQSAANKTKAIISEYSKLDPEDDDALESFTNNVARIGGPDFSKYDSDIRRQGFELWSNTFNDQMSQIAASPRGRELYGNLLSESFDYGKNTDHQNLKAEQYLSSKDGKNGVAVLNALKNGKQLYEVGHWSKPRLSTDPEASQQEEQGEAAQEAKPQMTDQDKLSLINDVMSATDRPEFDVDKVYGLAQKFIDSGIDINTSTPDAMRLSLHKAAKDAHNTDINYRASVEKSIPAAEAAIKIDQNNLKYNRLEAWETQRQATTQEDFDKAAEGLKRANLAYHSFNLDHLPEASKKEYDESMSKFKQDETILSGQTIALAKAAQAAAAMNPRELGSFGSKVDMFNDFVGELIGGNAQDLSSPGASSEAFATAIDEYVMAVKKGGVTRLPEDYAASLKESNLQTIIELLESTNEHRLAATNHSDAYKSYVGEYRSTSGAPKNQDYIEKQLARTEESIKKVRNSQKRTVDGDTLETAVARRSVQQAPVEQSVDLEALMAEAARRGIK